MNLKTPRIKAAYRCNQEELYTVCLIAWNSYLQTVSDFNNISTIYTTPFGQNQISETKAAKKLPDYQERGETSETLHIQLKEAADQCLILWKFLESHIKKAFQHNLHKPKLEGAGSTHYYRALNSNWEYVSALMQAGTHFITDNTAILTTGGMPTTFPSAFTTAQTTFDTLLSQFKNAEQTKEQLRDAKIQANNTIFRNLSSMLQDGKKIYRHDAATRERFTFTKILHLVTKSDNKHTETNTNT